MSMTPNQQKLTFARAFLSECPFVRLNALAPGVAVPSHLRREDLTLRIGEDPKVMGMPDLVMDEWGWSATLVVRGVRYVARVPWTAVVQIWIGLPHGFVGAWPVPGADDEAAPDPALTPEAPKPRGSLRLVKT